MQAANDNTARPPDPVTVWDLARAIATVFANLPIRPFLVADDDLPREED